MALLSVHADDHGARRAVETWLRVAGGALPIEEVVIKWRERFNFSATILDEDTVQKNLAFTGFPIVNGLVRLPD